ncbi:mitochondrial import receptor subunit TOM40-1 [Physcomitrium patens]|uniref:mitochondrial import receptor subunit TOM40-1 n=1 Tax=Physcomitrium patens TaxID=3218 RepID=UPI000D167AEA|nr:mitochondrial import receptor subunit TOM40-1-like [Physcomitrium patens]XP_024360220.1 mitochondrial import receptor subunit TOM40-1-like [Physcomitrium patens]|eukprot:XP_024360219.1 mitochondrial import receptor subunit TOM40-1-like [Physcomitrella patens]
MGSAVSYCSPQQIQTVDLCGSEGKAPESTNLPCPVKYEEINHEAYMSLKPGLFEGLRFDVYRSMNRKFGLSNSLFMGSVDLPDCAPDPLKQSTAHFELGANLIDQKGKMDVVLMMGRVLSKGCMSARVKCDITNRFSIKANAELTNEPHFSVGMFNFDYKGNDYQAQLTMGNSAFYSVNYTQRVTPKLSLGGEWMWFGHQRKSCMGLAARYQTDSVITTALVKSEGDICCTYIQKLSDKVLVASDFVYNWNSTEAVTSIAYDHLLNQYRIRGRIDTNLCTAAYLEEKISAGLTLVLSAELDHRKKDYKFGFGLTVGD